MLSGRATLHPDADKSWVPERCLYLPIDSKGNALIIEIDELADQVAQKMLDAGVPVEYVHVD